MPQPHTLDGRFIIAHILCVLSRPWWSSSLELYAVSKIFLLYTNIASK
jgi:hypothetical protein